MRLPSTTRLREDVRVSPVPANKAIAVVVGTFLRSASYPMVRHSEKRVHLLRCSGYKHCETATHVPRTVPMFIIIAVVCRLVHLYGRSSYEATEYGGSEAQSLDTQKAH